jgi:hypothetical protein
MTDILLSSYCPLHASQTPISRDDIHRAKVEVLIYRSTTQLQCPPYFLLVMHHRTYLRSYLPKSKERSGTRPPTIPDRKTSPPTSRYLGKKRAWVHVVNEWTLRSTKRTTCDALKVRRVELGSGVASFTTGISQLDSGSTQRRVRSVCIEASFRFVTIRVRNAGKENVYAM